MSETTTVMTIGIQVNRRRRRRWRASLKRSRALCSSAAVGSSSNNVMRRSSLVESVVSRESLDDPDDFVSAVALGTAVVDEISNPVNDRTSLGRPGHGDAASPLKVEESLIPQDVQG